MDEATVNELTRARLVHEIHTSERKSFRGCRRRWDWIFRGFYYPRVTAKPLEFGVAYHNAMETLYDPDTWHMPRDIILNSAIQKFVETCREQEEKYLELKKKNTFDDEEEGDYEERIKLGTGMLRHFANEIMPTWDQGWKPRHVEVEFLAPIQNPDTNEYLWCKCERCKKTQYDHWTANQDEYTKYCKGKNVPAYNAIDWSAWDGLPVVLAGRIDAIMEDVQGHLWIVDWKTAAQISRERNDTFLYTDDQISSYVMALRRKLGIDIRGFVYVELRKGYPEPPQLNSSRRLGRLYSVNKNQMTDYDTYLKTVKENDTEAYEAGLYDDFLTFLKGEGITYAHRYQIRKTDWELEQIERTLFAEVSDMINPDLKIYPNAGKFNCGFCAFIQPCIAKNTGEDYQFLLDENFDKRKEHYWVKEALPTTDKQ